MDSWLDEVEARGLLLLTDPKRPSLAGLVAGEPIRGSWWSHPKSHAIFAAASALDDHADVTTAKLIAGKVTFVHRRLFESLVTVGRAQEAWQLDDLEGAATDLLAEVEARGTMLASGPPVKLLERRLLVATRQEHTPSGKHVLVLSSWEAFAKARGVSLARRSVARAKAELEACATGPVPWPR